MPEVPINTATPDQGRISGKVNWSLGYLGEKEHQGMLVTIEPKAASKYEDALPQVIAYIAGIRDVRKKANKINDAVLSIITDSNVYIFLLENDKVYVTRIRDCYEDKTRHVLVGSWVEGCIKGG